MTNLTPAYLAARNFSAIVRKYDIQRTTLSRCFRSVEKDPKASTCHSSEKLLDEAQRYVLLERLKVLSLRKIYVTLAILRNMAQEICGRRLVGVGHQDSSKVRQRI